MRVYYFHFECRRTALNTRTVEAVDQVTEIKEEKYSVVGGGIFRHIGRLGSWASTSAKQRLEQGVSHAVNATLEVGKTARQSVGSVIQVLSSE